MDLHGIGVWGGELRTDGPGAAADVARAGAELEQLGYTALWVPEGGGGPLFESVALLLDATTDITVATGILNVWLHEPAETAERYAELEAAHPGRLLLGLGISHSALFDDPTRYSRPLGTMRDYVTALEGADPPVPADRMILAALGPRMLALAGERTCGAHPYLIDARHTRLARAALGPDPVLAPEVAVVWERDAERALEIGRAHVARYLDLPNFTDNLLRIGYDERDLRDGGSDRLIRGLVASGDAEAVRARVDEHRDAGADHVGLHVLTEPRQLPLTAWRELAPVLLG